MTLKLSVDPNSLKYVRKPLAVMFLLHTLQGPFLLGTHTFLTSVLENMPLLCGSKNLNERCFRSEKREGTGQRWTVTWSSLERLIIAF